MHSAVCWINSTHTHTPWPVPGCHPEAELAPVTWGISWGTLTPMGWGTLTPTNSRLQILSHPPASFLSALSPALDCRAATPFLFRLWLRGCSWGQGSPHPPQVPPLLQAWPPTLFFSLFCLSLFFVFPSLWVSVLHLWISIFPWLSFLWVYFFFSFLPSCPILSSLFGEPRNRCVTLGRSLCLSPP